MSLVSLIKGSRGASGFGYASTAEDVTRGLDLTGKTYLVTGVNSGLGEETARVLVLRGGRVLGTARTEEKAREACAKLGDRAIPLACELSEPSSVRACVAAVKALGLPIDALICNAGVMALAKREVAHGQEMQLLTNHFGHAILVLGLLDTLAPKGRVVMLSSDAHHRAPDVGIDFDDLSLERSYSPWSAYGQSKLANLLFAKSVAKVLEGTGKTANALHPGVIATNLWRHMNVVARVAAPVAAAVAMKNVQEGAATQCYVATHPSLDGVSGEYFADCNIAKPSRHARNDAMAERLFTETERILRTL